MSTHIVIALHYPPPSYYTFAVILCAEHQVCHVSRENKRILPCGGVFKPQRWGLTPHPVGGAGGHEAQHHPDGLARHLEAVQ